MDITRTNSNKLDPKLKETYDRIMGIGQPSNSTPIQPAAPLMKNIQQGSIPTPQPPNSSMQIPTSPMPTLKIPTQTQNMPLQELNNNPLPQEVAPAMPISPFQETPPPPKFETQIIQEQSPLTEKAPANEQDILSSPLLQSTAYLDPKLNQNTAINQPAHDKKNKKGHGLISFILGVGVVIFLVIYAIVWAKVFGLF